MTKPYNRLPQERLQEGRYVFAGVPNDEEGEKFFQDIRKYLHTQEGYRRESVRRRWRGPGKWWGACPRSKADSFVIYIEERNT